MKRNRQLESKRNAFVCLGITLILLAGFSACDFEPSKIGRAIGGSLAEGEDVGNEFIEDAGPAGGSPDEYKRSGDLAWPFLSKQEIRKMLGDTDSKNLPSPVMDEMPDWNPQSGTTWNPGKVNQKALELALARLNAIRRICGLYPVVMFDENNKSAQYGAALMSLTKSFGHGGQPQPNGVDQATWQTGVNATTYGNLYQLPPEKLIDAVDGYCLDPGNPGIGHRITLLSPGQLQVGFGTVPARDGSFASNVLQVYGLPHSMKEGESKKPADFNYDFISYPAAGYFPLEGNLFGSPAYWHVEFNSNKYTVGPGKIIVTKLDTGEQWIEEHSGGGTIVFNKSNKWRPELGRYTFEVTGVRGKATGTPERFVFTTEFFER